MGVTCGHLCTTSVPSCPLTNMSNLTNNIYNHMILDYKPKHVLFRFNHLTTHSSAQCPLKGESLFSLFAFVFAAALWLTWRTKGQAIMN